mmetsp:Transcript_17013/g.59525  ORF Transcript_17013/g.59525 Transcript_17013/m.59525 type:complete len:706 (+) Transcript_17013:58-2175(+)|eukprot:CAMPEP_0204156386 /NCGR_PEP_ID=MMETSP0361-20130328/30388_1 /ASSEMBLY_ACC=CAM_ASM_000343 /TAXON_ID=268821 /ORGANISM="Scrippsiella Hangoei, Strain SHTV-5" /LENGTH=705 /DNA_ID=CAMNT_0051112007 /DNA_START=33 /DNA_END=2150 /DNA_ORIENTATION=-
MAKIEQFIRPRYLLGFAEDADAGAVRLISEILASSGLHIDIDGSAARKNDWAPFLVVSAGLDQVEREAERLGYLKAHKLLAPHVEGQGLGKIEFHRAAEEWNSGYDGYGSPDFWKPCERAQLLRALLDRVPVDGRQLQALQVTSETARTVTGSLVAALTIAGMLERVVPLDEADGSGDAATRSAVWNAAKFTVLAPTDAIQRYFGSYVAMYFEWMNSFTRWLAAPAVSGFVCFCHMRVSGYTVDDYPYLCFHSLFVVLWAVTFLCSWDRECAAKAWAWNVYGEERKAEIRPEFEGELRTSRVHGLKERFYPHHKRLLGYAVSVVVTSVMLCVAFVAMTCLLNLQGYMEEHATSFERIFYVPFLADFAKPGALFDPDQTEYFGLLTFVPTVLHVIVIMRLNTTYRKVAEWLTARENHRLLEHHEQSLIAKRFIFEAFDCYISLFYIAFVQQDMRKLRSELISLYTVDSLRRVLLETILPFIMKQVSKRKLRQLEGELKKTDQSQYTDALEALSQPEYEQFDDFMEIVIEVGYVILFADAFPVAALLTVATNVVEIKSDLFKLAQVYQRPVASRAATIGVWRRVLQVLVALSIVTNVLLFVMSEQLAAWTPSLYREAEEKDVLNGRVAQILDETGGSPDLVLKKRGTVYVAMIAFGLEHCLILAVVVIAMAIPSRPEWVSEEMRRTAWYKEEQAKKWRNEKGKDAAK